MREPDSSWHGVTRLAMVVAAVAATVRGGHCDSASACGQPGVSSLAGASARTVTTCTTATTAALQQRR